MTSKLLSLKWPPIAVRTKYIKQNRIVLLVTHFIKNCLGTSNSRAQSAVRRRPLRRGMGTCAELAAPPLPPSRTVSRSD